MSDGQHIEIINLLTEKTRSGSITWNADIFRYTYWEKGLCCTFRKSMMDVGKWSGFCCQMHGPAVFQIEYSHSSLLPEMSMLNDLFSLVESQVSGNMGEVLSILNSGKNAPVAPEFKWGNGEGPNWPWWRYTNETTKSIEGYVRGRSNDEWTAYNGGRMVEAEVCGVFTDLEAAKQRVEQMVKQRLEGKK